MSVGSKAHIKCYSGGVLIYEGHSTGKVSSEENSDGYFFRDKETGKMKEMKVGEIREHDGRKIQAVEGDCDEGCIFQTPAGCYQVYVSAGKTGPFAELT